MLYGDYDLQLGDADATGMYGGQRRTPPLQAASGQPNTVSPPAHVTSLQQDLIKLGFRCFGAPTGKFDDTTQWAVRELQIYAKMPAVAKEDTKSTATEYVDKLSQINNTGDGLYAGPVSGVVNAATRKVMEAWLKEDRRCPVVIDAWNKLASGSRTHRNIWRHDELEESRYAMAADFSGYYVPYKAGELIAIGQTLEYNHKFGPAGGTSISPPSMEVLPETTIGSPWTSLAPDFQSTFKLVRCIAEIECRAFFDLFNAYDRAVFSMGLVHWTLLAGKGELCEYLAAYAALSPSDYDRGFLSLGLECRPQSTGSKPAVHLQRDDGSFEPTGSAMNKLDYLRNWHWIYRFVMAARTIESFRRGMWAFVLGRIQRLRRAELQHDKLKKPGAGGTTTYPTIGEVFTSELATGLLLRWNVIRPLDVIVGRGLAGPMVTKVLDKAIAAAPSLSWTSDPSTWTQPYEDALIDAVLSLAASHDIDEVKNSIPRVAAFPQKDPHWTMDRTVITALSKARGSFLFAGVPAVAAAAVLQPPTGYPMGSETAEAPR